MDGLSGVPELGFLRSRHGGAQARYHLVQGVTAVHLAVKRSEIGDFGGGSLEPLRRWLGAQWPGWASSGWTPSGWASLWEYRAAQSRQARPEEARGASWGAV